MSKTWLKLINYRFSVTYQMSLWFFSLSLIVFDGFTLHQQKYFPSFMIDFYPFNYSEKVGWYIMHQYTVGPKTFSSYFKLLANNEKKTTMLFLYMFTIIILSYFELQWLGFLDIQKLLFCLILIINQVVSFGNMICHNDRSLLLHHLQNRCRIEKGDATMQGGVLLFMSVF